MNALPPLEKRAPAAAEDRPGWLSRAEAALAQGAVPEAIELWRQVLWTRAVNSVPQLPASLRRLCVAAADPLPGWMGIDSHRRLVGELLSAQSATIEWGAHSWDRVVVENTLPGAFSVALPDGFQGVVRVRVDDRELLGSGLAWPIDFRPVGWVMIEDQTLRGEVCFDWDIHASVSLALTCGRSVTVFDVPPAVPPCGTRSFSRRLHPIDVDDTQMQVALRLPGGRTESLLGSPLGLAARQPQPVAEPPPVVRARVRDLTRPVNIVVPIRASLEAALPCLRSLLATTSRHRAFITVVDERGTDAEVSAVTAALGRHAARLAWLRAGAGPSLVSALNRGIDHRPDLDVVIVSEEVEFLAGWLPRLCAAAYHGDHTGTVMPLTGAVRLADQSLAAYSQTSPDEAARLDLVARTVNARTLLDVPVGTGDCLYIKRQCLDEVGPFDDRDLDAGYGEVADFCLRARARGWRHVAHAGVVVRLRAPRDAGASEALLLRRNQRILEYRYPGCEALLDAFRGDRKLALAQRAIDEGRLVATAESMSRVVAVDESADGPQRMPARMALLAEQGIAMLWLRTEPAADRRARVVRVEAAGCNHLTYELPGEWPILSALLGTVKPIRIELHDRSGLEERILKLAAALGVPYRVFLHDYAWVCPRRTFLTGRGEYCGEPPVSDCEACVDRYGMRVRVSGTVANWRRRAAAVLKAAERVIVPSRDAAARLARYVPGLDPVVEMPPAPSDPKPRDPRSHTGAARVLVLEALDRLDGHGVLLECARDAVCRELALEFRAFGAARDAAALAGTGRVVLGEAPRGAQLRQLLERGSFDVALFPGSAPEVWCESLTSVLAAGLPVVAFDVGAVAERVRDAAAGVILAPGVSAAAINDALLGAAGIG